MFESVLTSTTGGLTITSALLCTAVSLLLGFLISFLYTFRSSCTKSFAITLALLPVLVQAVIMMVNGNLGTGVAVLGAFSLIRFRSVPGSGKEIVSIFFAMTVGLATGMGYLTFALLITMVVGGLLFLLGHTPFGEKKSAAKQLRVVIPENLDYTGLFDDLFGRYTSHVELDRVKTTNMGSLFELTYSIELKDTAQEKAFLDELRCRNGNMPVVCGRPVHDKDDPGAL